jgi:lysophospholipase L1-like esterase
MSMNRGIALGVPGVALATAGGLWAQVHHAAHAPLPRFDDLDPSGRYGDPAATAVRLTVLGDSSMTGPGLDRGDEVWVAQLAQRLPWDVRVHSVARGGSRVRDVVDHQLPVAIEDPPDAFVVAVGANDAIHGSPARTYARVLGELLDELRAVAPVVTLGIGDLSVIPRLPRSLRPVVAHRSAVFDRTHTLVAADRERVVRVPVAKLSDPHFRRHGVDLFAADLFHPNRRGHQLWADLFLPYVHRAVAGTAQPVIDLRSRVPAWS